MKLNFTFTIIVPALVERILQLPYLLYYRLFFGCDVRLIYIANFRFAVVDPADYDELRKFPWRLCRSSRTCYAFRTVPRGKNQTQNVFWMHRQIANPFDWLLVDHGNNNSLDNRRENLRNATKSQNQQNRNKVKRKTTSRFIGVYCEKRTGHWVACIVRHGKKITLGTYGNEIDAAKAYDNAAKKYRGEFAHLNFPNKQS